MTARGLALKLVLAPLALAASCSIAKPTTQVISLSPCINSDYVELVRIKATPFFAFWDKPSKGFLVCLGGKLSFVPLGADSGDMLSEISGPLGSVSNHMMFAAP